MPDSDHRRELLRWRETLQHELRAVEHSLHLVPESAAVVPRDAHSTLLDLVAEYSADLISVHGAGGDFVYASPNSRKLFGWEAAELEGTSPYDRIHPDDRERIAREHAACVRGEEASFRYRMRTPTGEYRWAESRSRVTDDGRYLVSVTRDVQREQVLLEELERRSNRDVLTGLLNRRGMEEALQRELERSRRQDTEMAVLYFDVDHFKEINDTLGHEAGDEVLRGIGDVVGARMRISDYAARWGGDEFLLLLPETGTVDAVRAAKRIARGVREALRGVTLSSGIATSARAGSVRELLRMADESLYSVKKQGGGWIEVHGCGLPTRGARRPRRTNPLTPA